MSTYQDAYNNWVQDQSPDNMAKLVDEFMPTINSEIMRYEGPKPLLRSKAKTLAIKAIRTYNPNSGTQLQSWVTTNLKPLARYGQGLRDVKMPEVALRQAAQLNRVTQDMTDINGKAPTDEELADEIGLSVKRIQNIRKMAVPSVNTGRFDQATSDDSQASQPGVYEPSKVPFATDAVYMSLDKRDQKIFDWRTGSHGSPVLSVTEIAARLGLSPASISQRADMISKQISSVASM